MQSVPRQNLVVLIFWAIAGAALFYFGCQLLEANGYSRWVCAMLGAVIILVFIFLCTGRRRSA